MTRSFLRAVARVMVGVVLMAQMAIAAYACPVLSAATAVNAQASAQVTSLDDSVNSGAAMAMRSQGNCDDMVGAMDPSSPNLCAEHCKVGQQSDHASTLNVPAAVLSALYVTPLVAETTPPPRPAAATMSALVAAFPPHAILHCVFRI
jgi:hypothetical protein